MTRRLLLFCVALFAATLGACKPKTETLSLLVWEGYADPSFVQLFEQAHHCKVVAAYMGSSDELVAKLRGGSASSYDVVSPSSDVAASIVRAGLAAPLDLSKIPAYSELSPRLRDSPLVKKDGQTYGVPFVWGPNPLLYDATAFPQPPDSWSILWNPKYRGKISLWDELSSVYMAAQVLGYDKPDPSQLYNLSAAPRELQRNLERGQERPVNAGAISTQNATSGGALLEVRRVVKSFGATQVLKCISLQIASGEFLTLL